eukprot:SAG11_NODE_3102_length_2690_cov_2.208800_2_plen_155_part_00
MDSAAANTKAVRAGGWAAGLNTYASAAALARLYAATLGGGVAGVGGAREPLLPAAVVGALCTAVAAESSVLEGRQVWGLGLQLAEPDGGGRTVVYSRGFGGLLVAAVPAAEVVIAVTVNQLTLEARPTKQLAALVGRALGVERELAAVWAGGLF